MKTRKEEKRRKKFRTLLLLLFLTIIMFGTSTYAWFTANRVVTINELDVHVDASNGIQISTNAENWKSVITNNDITSGAYSGAVNQVPTEVTAVSTDLVPTSAGRLKMYSSIIDNDATTGDYTIRTALETEAHGTTGKFIAFDLFVRVDTAQTVYLTSESDVINLDQTDRGLKNSARVAFVNLGNIAATSTPAQIIALNTGTTSGVTLWEPNSDAHTQFVVQQVAPDYNITLTETSSGSGLYNRVPYRGINSEITTAAPLKSVVNGTVTTNTTAITPTIITTENNAAYNTFVATFPAGVTKYRIYMWIEGQDIDCENNATGSNIGFKIQLSTENPNNSP